MLKLGSPDIIGFYDMLYGTAGVDLGSLSWLPMGASGIVWNGNPAYHLSDFMQWYPKFFGPSTPITAVVITAGSDLISGFAATDLANISVGDLVISGSTNSIDLDSFVILVDTANSAIQLNQPAIANGTDFAVYETPPVPLIVLQSYMSLAAASVMQTRYCEAWSYAMALFIAHYSTMWLRSEYMDPNAPASQVASSGIARGILTHRAAGDVSASSTLIQGYEQWGAWGYTQYGELFITLARATNMGAIWVP